MIGVILAILVIVLTCLLVIWPTRRIARRMGYSVWWSIVMLIPVVDLILIWIVGFNPWPAEKTSRADTTNRDGNEQLPPVPTE